MILHSFQQLQPLTTPTVAFKTKKVEPIIPDNRDFVDERMAIPRTNTTKGPSTCGLSPFISRDDNFRRIDSRFALKPHRIKAKVNKGKKAKKAKKQQDFYSITISEIW